MGVRKKGRRKIICDDQQYIWYVQVDQDSPCNILNVISEDKQLIISCPLKTETSYMISKGRLFQNHNTNGGWNRYGLPFDDPEMVTPGFVSKLVTWATKGSNAAEVKWNGTDIFV